MAVVGVPTERLSVNLPAIWEFTGKISVISCHGVIFKEFSQIGSMGYGVLLMVLIMYCPVGSGNLPHVSHIIYA
jgi:hypothetical protein